MLVVPQGCWPLLTGTGSMWTCGFRGRGLDTPPKNHALKSSAPGHERPSVAAGKGGVGTLGYPQTFKKRCDLVIVINW